LPPIWAQKNRAIDAVFGGAETGVQPMLTAMKANKNIKMPPKTGNTTGMYGTIASMGSFEACSLACGSDMLNTKICWKLPRFYLGNVRA
jgi:hypothetical protein